PSGQAVPVTLGRVMKDAGTPEDPLAIEEGPFNTSRQDAVPDADVARDQGRRPSAFAAYGDPEANVSDGSSYALRPLGALRPSSSSAGPSATRKRMPILAGEAGARDATPSPGSRGVPVPAADYAEPTAVGTQNASNKHLAALGATDHAPATSPFIPSAADTDARGPIATRKPSWRNPVLFVLSLCGILAAGAAHRRLFRRE
ncbi:MAG TPA: hypothetical protein PKI11_16100, partial [Candidatus Hydrogenedentes bacterium]|nr:hypothetical protein [Candidatus Hydrogenedentota bacterium]